MDTHDGIVGLECCQCGEQKTITADEARFTFAALVRWCCPRCLTPQPWPVHLLDDAATRNAAVENELT